AIEQEEACAEKILANLARQAFRRPVTDADIAAPLAFYENARADGGDFDAGIRAAVARLIVSPFFLFRVETDSPDTAPGADHPIDGYALASRLAFFLWSSTPDAELLERAGNEQLADAGEREAQVRRML